MQSFRQVQRIAQPESGSSDVGALKYGLPASHACAADLILFRLLPAFLSFTLSATISVYFGEANAVDTECCSALFAVASSGYPDPWVDPKSRSPGTTWGEYLSSRGGGGVGGGSYAIRSLVPKERLHEIHKQHGPKGPPLAELNVSNLEVWFLRRAPR